MRGLTRRQALQCLGGGALGTLLSPLPWKLLDDLAIWTQNGPHVARIPTGRPSTRISHCSLCPAGCGLQVRCVDGRPIAVSGVPSHPRSAGVTCALGLVAHHFSFHGRRAFGPLWREDPSQPSRVRKISSQAAERLLLAWVEAAREHDQGPAIVLLDGRPERCVSIVYRQWLGALACGAYIPLPTPAASVLEPLLQEPADPLGVDLENVGTLLSFGVPVLDGWSAPGRALARRRHRQDDLQLIQVETRPSPTALRADHWLKLRPGTEAVLALGLAHLVLQDGHLQRGPSLHRADDFDAYERLVAPFGPERVASLTGIPPEELRSIARELLSTGPALALAGTGPGCGMLDERARLAIGGLNLLFGNLERRGGFVRRASLPAPAELSHAPLAPSMQWAHLPDHAVQLLIIDAVATAATIPWLFLQRKLTRDARVVCLSPFDNGLSRRAHLLLPTAPMMECLEEIGPGPDDPVASYALGVPLRPPRAETVDPGALSLRLVAATTPWLVSNTSWRNGEDLIRKRIEAIHATGRGSLFDARDGVTRPLLEVDSPQSLEEALRQGSCWIDTPVPPTRIERFSFLGHDGALRKALWELAEVQTLHVQPAGSVSLCPFVGPTAVCSSLPPLLTKLVRDSELVPPGGTGFIHPATAHALGIEGDGWVRVETHRGGAPLLLHRDAAVPEGALCVAVSPDPGDFAERGPGLGARILELCDVSPEGAWQPTPARLKTGPVEFTEGEAT